MSEKTLILNAKARKQMYLKSVCLDLRGREKRTSYKRLYDPYLRRFFFHRANSVIPGKKSKEVTDDKKVKCTDGETKTHRRLLRQQRDYTEEDVRDIEKAKMKNFLRQQQQGEQQMTLPEFREQMLNEFLEHQAAVLRAERIRLEGADFNSDALDLDLLRCKKVKRRDLRVIQAEAECELNREKKEKEEEERRQRQRCAVEQRRADALRRLLLQRVTASDQAALDEIKKKREQLHRNNITTEASTPVCPLKKTVSFVTKKNTMVSIAKLGRRVQQVNPQEGTMGEVMTGKTVMTNAKPRGETYLKSTHLDYRPQLMKTSYKELLDPYLRNYFHYRKNSVIPGKKRKEVTDDNKATCTDGETKTHRRLLRQERILTEDAIREIERAKMLCFLRRQQQGGQQMTLTELREQMLNEYLEHQAAVLRAERIRLEGADFNSDALDLELMRCKEAKRRDLRVVQAEAQGKFNREKIQREKEETRQRQLFPGGAPEQRRADALRRRLLQQVAASDQAALNEIRKKREQLHRNNITTESPDARDAVER